MKKNVAPLVGSFLAVFFIALPLRGFAFPLRAPEVQIIDMETRYVQDHFFAFEKNYHGGVRVATGDVDGDGEEEIVVAESSGPDAHGRIRIFSRTHDIKAEWIAFPEAVMHQELSLAVADIDNDRKEEILVSRPRTTSSTIAIFDEHGKLDAQTSGMVVSFPEEHRGVVVAAGNTHTQASIEMIAALFGDTTPRVRFFDAQGIQHREMTPFGEEQYAILEMLAADTNGDNLDELIFTHKDNTEQAVVVMTAGDTSTRLGIFRAWSREWPSGTRVAAYDRDRNGTDELALVPSADQRATMRIVRGDGVADAFEPLLLFEEDFLGGADVAFAQMDDDITFEAVVVPTKQQQRADPARGEKYIEVDLSEQKFFLWEGGYLRQAYLISSGLPGTPTPTGEFSILKKIERHLYDGPNYYFPNTPWNLRFKEGAAGRNMYFHTAYWHNNFGKPMSHGCVNMRAADAKFLYFWADIGTPAWIHE